MDIRTRKPEPGYESVPEGWVTPRKPPPPWMAKLPRFLSTPLRLIIATVQGFSAEDVPTHAASLAYYTVFSIAPTVVVVIAMVGVFFGEEAARGGIEAQIEGLVGETGASAIEDMVAASSKPASTVWASIVGIAAALFGATGVFAALQGTLNWIWHAPPPKINGILAFLRVRFLSFTMVLGVGFLLLVSLVVSAGLNAVSTYLGNLVTGWETVLFVLNNLISLGVVAVMFAFMFKVLPDVSIAWRDVWLGAAVTAVLFTIGKALIGLYIGQTAMASSYGAAGSLAVLLAWVYYSSFILFFGAVLTRTVAQERGTFPAVAPRPAVHMSPPKKAGEKVKPPPFKPGEAEAHERATAPRGGAGAPTT